MSDDVLARLDLDHQQYAARGEASLFGDAAAEIRRLRNRLRAKRCGCAWCCAEVPPDQRGEMHQRTCQPRVVPPAEGR